MSKPFVSPLVTVATEEPQPARMDYMTCPACSSKQVQQNVPGLPAGVKVCRRCDAIFGQCYLGDSYGIVLPLWDAAGACAEGEARYYDFTCVGSGGLTRRHGWYNPATKRITQTG